jgi:hypothetical protein
MFGASTMFWIDAGAMALGKVSAIMVSNCVNITFSVFCGDCCGCGGWGIGSVSFVFFPLWMGITLF